MMTKVSKGLTALVTGGASGLGKGTVDVLFMKGFRVAILDLPSSNGAEIAKAYGDDDRCIFTPADVTSEADVVDALQSVKKKFSYLNVNVNCAGIAYARKTYSFTKNAMQSLEEIDRTMKVNVIGTLNMIRYAAQLMAENEKNEMGQRGVIINTTSIAAYDGQLGQVAYAASKGAIASMTLPLAREMADDGIRIMAIAPGVFDTPLVNCLPPKAIQFLNSLVPNPKRLGDPSEFGALVHHIIENQYLNGEVIRLDGALRMPP